MVTTTIKIENAERIIDRARASNLMAAPLRKALTASAFVVQNDAKKESPVDTGRLRASITNAVDASAVPRFATVGTNVIYARAVHDGRKPGSQPPTAGELALWARRHGNINPYVLARSIKRRGTKPRPFLRSAFEANLDRIRGYFETAGRDIERLWSQGA
jgi:phage gpG-like protein